MKMVKAFSNDFKANFTADKADQLYSEGKIASKFSFKCPDDNCNAAVTCANLDRPKHQRKRDPYYKVSSGHSDNCNIAKDLKFQKKHCLRTLQDETSNKKWLY